MHSFKTTYVVKVHHFEKIHYCSHRINRNKCFNHLRKDFRFWVSWYLVFLFWALSAIVVMLRKREQKAVRGTIFFFLKKKGPFFTFSLMILRILRQLWDISYFPGITLCKPVRKGLFEDVNLLSWTIGARYAVLNQKSQKKFKAITSALYNLSLCCLLSSSFFGR